MFERLKKRMRVKKTRPFTRHSSNKLVDRCHDIDGSYPQIRVGESKSIYETVRGLLAFVVTRIAITGNGLHSL